MRSKAFAQAVTTLAPRELQMVRLVAKGWSNPRIAAELGLAVKTVENTLVRAMRRFSPRISRGELIRMWAEANTHEQGR